jgi:hypothetical protein
MGSPNVWPKLGERVVTLPFESRHCRPDLCRRLAGVAITSPVPEGCVGVFIDGMITARWWPVAALVDARTYGIGEGQALARARMERFVAWLGSLPACAERAEVIEAAHHARSPEAAVRDIAAYGDGPTLRWFALRVGHDHWRRMGRASEEAGWGVRRDAFERVVDQMLGLGEFVDKGASPEWAALSASWSEGVR